MSKRGFRARVTRVLMAMTIGGCTFQLSGCDPEVRTTLLGGLESTTQGLASSLVSAFFLTLGNDGSSGAGALTTTSP